MKITIINQSGRAVPRRFLHLWMARLERLAKGELNRDVRDIGRDAGVRGRERKILARTYRKKELIVVFLSRQEARRLNRTFRRRDYATDVLSFSSGEPDVLGELVICPEVISKQAKENGLLVREELGYMVLHGFLHLLGYDHERSKAEERRMFAIQDRLFERLLSQVS